MGKILDRIKEGFKNIFISPSIEDIEGEVALSNSDMELLKKATTMTSDIRKQEDRFNYDGKAQFVIDKSKLKRTNTEKVTQNKEPKQVVQEKSRDDER